MTFPNPFLELLTEAHALVVSPGAGTILGSPHFPFQEMGMPEKHCRWVFCVAHSVLIVGAGPGPVELSSHPCGPQYSSWSAAYWSQSVTPGFWV